MGQDEYQQAMVRNKGLMPDEAMAPAERQSEDMLTNEPTTSDHNLFVAERAHSGERVG
jgi:hypothetical protein